METPASPPVLPYPHARNDCERCREYDADFQVLGDHPTRMLIRFCRSCFGEVVLVRAVAAENPAADHHLAFRIVPFGEGENR